MMWQADQGIEMTTQFEPGYYVTVELRLKDSSKLDIAKKALDELATQSLTENGCSIFLAQYDTKTPTRIIFWERFDDEAASKKHFEEPHTKAYSALGLTEVVQVFSTNIV